MFTVLFFDAIRIALLKRNINSCNLIYDDHTLFIARRSKLRFLYPLFKLFFAPLIFKQADALVGVAELCKDFMHKIYGFPTENILVIPLGADDSLFQFDLEARKELRKQFLLEEGDVLFIYTGKIIPPKAPHLLVEAAIMLMKKYSKVKVLLVGNGSPEYIKEMKDRIAKQKLENGFIWHPAVPNKELYRFYSAADVAVWPQEASLSMMEAMACGLPVIIADGSEVRERVRYNNGLLYENKDSSHLAQQMERLLDPELRRQMGANGRKYIEEQLSWRVISRQFLQLYAGKSTVDFDSGGAYEDFLHC